MFELCKNANFDVCAVTGVEVANAAMEKVYARVPPEKWVFVSVAVAPSTVTISEHGVSRKNIIGLNLVIENSEPLFCHF